MRQRIKGILFDLGETILDFGRIDLPALFKQGTKLAHEYLTQLGKNPPPFDRFHRVQSRALHWNIFTSHLTGRDFNALDLIATITQKMGLQLDREHFVALAGMWYEPLKEHASIQQGVHEMLREFRGNGLTLGIVSNTFVPSEVLDAHLEQEGLLELLPIRVYSCDVTYRKPNRKIFQIALEKVGLDAKQTIFVGDSIWADIRGANRMGMVSVLKDSADRGLKRWIKPDYHIRSLLDLREIVAGNNG